MKGADRSMKTKRFSVGQLLIQLFLIIWTVACLFPLYWLFTFSLKDNNEIFGGNVVGLPHNWIWSNYANAWGAGNISLYLRNSVITTAVTLLLTLLLSFMSSYGLLRMRWKGQKATLTYLLLGLMIPMHAALLPLLGVLLKLNVLSTHWGLIIPYTAFNIPMAILIISGFIGAIPYDMEEAAFMAWHALMLEPDLPSMGQALLDRHYLRKHGKNAYYGQG